MALSITRLSGGTTPADGSDPRTYPAIWNATATALEAVATDLDTLALSSLDGVTVSSPVDGNLLTYDGAAWVNAVPAVPAGSVLQVVSTAKTDTFSASTAGGAFTSITGLTATITPVSTSSKVLVFVSVSGSAETGNGFLSFRTTRASTAIGVGATAGSRSSVTSSQTGAFAVDSNGLATANSQFLDAPASSSSLEYGVDLHNAQSGTKTLYVNRSAVDGDASNRERAISTITLMEVAG